VCRGEAQLRHGTPAPIWRRDDRAFAAIGTGQVTGLVGAHNLHGLTGATADGRTWQVSHGILQVTPPFLDDARRASIDPGKQRAIGLAAS
jgi:hypothetical protein